MTKKVKNEVEEKMDHKNNKKSKKKAIIISIFISVIAGVIIGIVALLGGFGPKWRKQIAFSDLKFEDDYIVGRIQNKSDKHLDVTITFELKSGSIKDTDYCYVNIDPNTIDDLKCLAYGKDGSYKIKVVNVEIEEIKNKTFEDKDELSVDDLKDYFRDIYNKHTEVFGMTFMTYEKDFDEELKYPYVDSVRYYKTSAGSEIYINTPIKYKGDFISISETYDANTGKLMEIFISSSSAQDSKDFLVKAISFGYFHEDIDPGKYERAKKLLSEDTAEGKCFVFGELCFESTVTDRVVIITGHSDFE